MAIEYSTLDEFFIIRTLGAGCSSKVKLAKDKDTGKFFALKVMRREFGSKKFCRKVLEKEFNILRELNHDNIGKVLKIQLDGKYVSKKGNRVSSKVYTVNELSSQGELFDIVLSSNGFCENLARFFFKQVVSAVNYLHSREVAHRDIKLENLILGDKMTLKLIDFGFATSVIPERKKSKVLGTKGYMAPEVLSKMPYEAKKVDVFAMGVLLFNLYCGHPPFITATKSDPYYYNAFILNPKGFWIFHQRQNPKNPISESFKELITGMLSFNSSERYTLTDVLKSEWLNEPVNITVAETNFTAVMSRMKVSVSNTIFKSEQSASTREVSERAVDMEASKNHPLVHIAKKTSNNNDWISQKIGALLPESIDTPNSATKYRNSENPNENLSLLNPQISLVVGELVIEDPSVTRKDAKLVLETGKIFLQACLPSHQHTRSSNAHDSLAEYFSL
jgi:serine/threonine protein kinase